MTTITMSSSAFPTAPEPERFVSHRITRYAVPVGRVLFALPFLISAPMHFTAGLVHYAASQGVFFPQLLVPLSGLLALIGGLSIALGYKARLGAFLLVVFLVPVTWTMHKFWILADPQAAMVQQAMFFKNVAMLGCALFLTHVGAGPISLDARGYKALTLQHGA